MITDFLWITETNKLRRW